MKIERRYRNGWFCDYIYCKNRVSHDAYVLYLTQQEFESLGLKKWILKNLIALFYARNEYDVELCFTHFKMLVEKNRNRLGDFALALV